MIALVMGRGVEGCGVTRYTVEYKNWLEKQGKEVVVYALKEKSFSRGKAQIFDYKIFTPSDDISGELNECDYIVYMSVPSTSNSKKGIDNFVENCVYKVTPKKIFIQLDHKRQSLQRNARMWDVVEHCDIVFNYSRTTDFGIQFDKHFGPTLVPRERPIPKYEYFRVAMDFDTVLPLRKKFSEKVDRASYFGRFARFKHPERVIDLRKHLKGNIITEMRGLERSIGALDIFGHPDIIEVKKGADVEQNCFNKTYVHGPYNRNEGMEELSRSKFGCSFYELDARYYGYQVEYAMLEIVGLGLIPVFSKHWGDNTKHYSGVNFSSIEGSGIYMSSSNIDEVCDEMNRLNDESVYNTYVDNCINIYKEHSSADRCFTELQKTIGEIL
jgi:hypothetical protein